MDAGVYSVAKPQAMKNVLWWTISFVHVNRVTRYRQVHFVGGNPEVSLKADQFGTDDGLTQF